MVDVPYHPAKYSPEILRVFDAWIRMESFWRHKRQRRMRVLDPMAGVGRVHTLPGKTFGIEIEREWAEAHPRTQVGDALALPWRRYSFDVIAVSPTYGNRLADHHNAQDGSTRHSYTHDLGRKLHPNNSGAMHWGTDYRTFHRAAWTEAVRVLLRPGGLFLLSISDHIRAGLPVPVTQWHLDTLTFLGLREFARRDIETKRMRYGQNREDRVGFEHVVALRNA